MLISAILLPSVTACDEAPPELFELPARERPGIVEAVEEILETGSRAETVETEEVPLNNCGGNKPLVVDVARSRDIAYAVTDQLGGNFGLKFWLLQSDLDKHYGSIDGKIETQTYTLHLEADANSHVVYELAWKEIWAEGTAAVTTLGGERKAVPYQVKRALRLEVKSSKELACR
jgi:hypothetical protein